ncbi:MAG: hypothetical protein U5P41_08075 [Gammaproteobacteria bacterium]|nr:hypothetical protein [Gammaproteobacteria bacterium]
MFCISMPVFAQDNETGAEAGNAEEPARELSAAEKDILLPGHMDNIDEPVRIRYDFRRSGSFEDGFEDRVIHGCAGDTLMTAPLPSDLDFFSGPHEVTFIQKHNEENVMINSTIFIYLQGDVYEMTRLANRKPQLNFYFNKRIRHALVDDYEMETVEVPYDGGQVKATKYTITPYAEDPNRVNYDKFADKRYEFVMSDEIPGKLYQIHTVIPDNVNKGAPPLIEETLTFAGTESPKQRSAKAD